MNDNNTMILGNSNHPVEIKKIGIRIWRLRDEIEKVLEVKLADLNTESEEGKNALDEVEKTYSFLSRPMAEVIPLHKEENNQEENSEEESNEENSDEESTEEKKDEESTEEDSSEEEKENNEEEANEEEAVKEPGGPTEEVTLSTPPAPPLEEEKVASGVCFLADLSMDYIHFFSEDLFIEGQTIVIEFMVPSKFNLVAEITRSINYNLKSRIISSSRPPYRLSAKFRLERPGDRSIFRRFLQSIEPNIPPPRKAKPVVEEDGDDLDGFDLD